MFEIFLREKTGLQRIVLHNSLTNECVEIIPDLGGTVYKIALNRNGILHDVLASDGEELLRENPLYRGRILFPFHDCIPYGIYQFRGKYFELIINCAEDGSAIHGLLYDKDW